MSLFARHFSKSPELLGPEQIRAYQIYLTNERKLATKSILLAIVALRFLYKVTLKKNWVIETIIPAPKAPQTLPVVLSPEEVIQFLDCVSSRKYRAILTTCYAAGLRISEAVALAPLVIDSKRTVLRVERAKDKKITAQIRTSASTHTALTKDEWRRSVRRDRGAELVVEESTGSRLG